MSAPAGPSQANGTHVSEADAHLFLDADDSSDEEEDSEEGSGESDSDSGSAEYPNDERGAANGKH